MYTEKLIECGRMNYKEITELENSGDRSWEYCHSEFLKHRGKKMSQEEKDYLCLHLAWYLASWGMLRNSFLRRFDYKIHMAAVEEIYKEEWHDLWDVDYADVDKDKAKRIKKLSEAVSGIYRKYRKIAEKSDGKEPKDKDITDTLQTKILLGTVGCVPAYDTYFKNALKNTGAASNTYGEKSIVSLGKYYREHKGEFEKLKEACPGYPSAKILDMCFFTYGVLTDKIENMIKDQGCLGDVSGNSTEGKKMKRALVLSVIHGDDKESESAKIRSELESDNKFEKYFK